MKYLSCVLPFFFFFKFIAIPKYLCTVHHLIFPGWRCTRRLMERCASTRNPSTPRRRSSTTRGSSTTWRWERAAWVGGGWGRMRGHAWAAAVTCLFILDFVYEWRGGPVAKGCRWYLASFTLNEYLILKKAAFQLPSKAFVLQSFRAQRWRRCVRGGNTVNAAPWLPPSSFFLFFFDPSSHVYGPPPFHLWVFVVILQTNTFSCLLSSLTALLSFTLPLPSLRWSSLQKRVFLFIIISVSAFHFLQVCECVWVCYNQTEAFWKCNVFKVAWMVKERWWRSTLSLLTQLPPVAYYTFIGQMQLTTLSFILPLLSLSEHLPLLSNSQHHSEPIFSNTVCCSCHLVGVWFQIEALLHRFGTSVFLLLHPVLVMTC